MSARDAAIPSTLPPEAVRDAPASRAAVWWALREIGPATFAAVIRATGLSKPTVADALTALVDADVVSKQPSDDGRVPLYDLSTEVG